MTPRQHNLLSYIRAYITDNGHAPSFDEMAGALGLASKSGVHRIVTSLEEQGLIMRGKNRARQITLVDGDALRVWSNQALADELVRRGVRLPMIPAA